MKAPENQDQLQKTLIQLENGRRQMESLSRQGKMAETALIEVNTTIHALTSLEDVKEGTEILVSLGANTFVKATLKDKENILTGIGAGFSVEKKRGEALKSLEARKEELTKALDNINRMSAGLESKLVELNDAAEGMLGRSK